VKFSPVLIPVVVAAISAVATAQGQSRTPEIRVLLGRSDTRDDSHLPYRRADLTVEYLSSGPDAGGGRDVIRCITIRSARGGPTMLSRVTVPVASPPQKLSVLLPPLSAQESYRVRLLTGETEDSDLLGEFDLSLDFPPQWVTAETFVESEAYDEGDYAPPRWSNRTLLNVFVTAVIASVLTAATLFVRSGERRIVSAVLVAATSAIVLWMTATTEPAVVRRPISDEAMMLVTCRRTSECRLPPKYTVPLYYDLEEMARDSAVIHTPDGLVVRLAGRDVRLFARTSD